MSDHEHDWQPGPGFGRYVCACGATGWRYSVNTRVMAHKTPRDWSTKATVREGAPRKGRRGPGGWSPGGPK